VNDSTLIKLCFPKIHIGVRLGQVRLGWSMSEVLDLIGGNVTVKRV
jgi:hypothetical protein